MVLFKMNPKINLVSIPRLKILFPLLFVCLCFSSTAWGQVVFAGDPQELNPPVTSARIKGAADKGTGSVPLTYWAAIGKNASSVTFADIASPETDAYFNQGGVFYLTLSAVYVDKNGKSDTLSDTTHVTVNKIPVITQQPADTTVNAGTMATFTVVATGYPLPTYKWQKSSDGTNWSDIPSETTSIFTIQNTIPKDDSTLYRCLVQNTILGNNNVVTSSVALLRVRYAPKISTQPISATVTAPAAQSFTVVADGNPKPTYEWQNKSSLVWSPIGGATSSIYTIDTTTSGNNGTKYRCILKNTVGTVTTDSVTLAVLYPPSITTQPLPKTVQESNSVQFTVVATGNPAPTFQWKNAGNNLPTETLASYTIPKTSMSDNGAQISVEVKNTLGGITSDNAMLTVLRRPPGITKPPANATVIEGQAATFTVEASGTLELFYKWQKNGIPIPGATSQSYTTPPTVFADNGALFSCIVSNPADTVTSQNGVLTVIRAPVFTNALTATGNVGTLFSFNLTASGTTPITFGASPLPTGLSLNTGTGLISGTPSAVGVIVANLTATNSGGSAPPKSLTITINAATAAPVITKDLLDTLKVVFKTRATFSIVATGNPTPTYQWQYLNSQNVVTNIGTNSPTFTIDSALVSSAGRYRVIASNGVLPRDTSHLCRLIVQVPPKINTPPISQSILVGQNVKFSVLATGSSPLKYQWQKGSVDIDSATKDSLVLTNIKTTDAGNYRVTVSNDAGKDSSVAATLTVTLPKLSLPQILPPETDFYPKVSVSINGDTGTTFHYTLDGSDPISTSLAYTGTFDLTSTKTVKVRAYKKDYLASDIVTRTYTLTVPGKVPKPVNAPIDTNFSGSVNVTLSTSHLGAKIYYTQDGSLPTISSLEYKGAITLFQTTPIKAFAVESGLLNSDTLQVLYHLDQPPPKVALPSALPAGRRFRTQINVQLSTTTDSAIIWYTTDSTNPLISGTRIELLNGGVNLTQNTLLKFAARRQGWQPSDVVTETYNLDPGPIVCFPSENTFFSDSQIVTVSVPGGYPIYYSLDGTIPIDSLMVKKAGAFTYTASLKFKESTTFIAVAVNGKSASDTLVRFFTKQGSRLPYPTANPAGRLFKDSLMVSMASPDSTVKIHYTLDGNLPTTSSAIYTKALRLDTTTTLQAMAVKTGFQTSLVMLETYTLSPDTPSMIPKGGRYFGSVPVLLKSPSKKAQIYYTLDGSIPSATTGILYTNTPIVLAKSSILIAVAVAGDLTSPIRTEIYTISQGVDTLILPNETIILGGGYSLIHLGQSLITVHAIIANPDAVKVNGFSDIPFLLSLQTQNIGEIFPIIKFIKPASDTRYLYRTSSDGRAYFVSKSDTTTITIAGNYFLGNDIVPPTVTYLQESILSTDSTQAEFLVNDNVINVLYSLQRSDAPSRNISQKVLLTPDTLMPTLKNPEAFYEPLSVIIIVDDHRNTIRSPANSGAWQLGQKLAGIQSPAIFHIGEKLVQLNNKTKTTLPWDLVSFPIDPIEPITFAQLAITNLGVAQFNPTIGSDGGLERLKPKDSWSVGKGYWLASTKPHNSLILPPLTSHSPSLRTWKISLNIGWNLIGNPYPKKMYWPHSRKGVTYPNSLIKAPWSFDFPNQTYAKSDSLEPWKGYFVYSYVDSSVTLLSTPPQSLSKMASNASPVYDVGLTLQYGAGSPVDLGTTSNAQVGLGIEDETALPSIASQAWLASLRNGKELQSDYIPFHPDSILHWDLVVHNPDPQSLAQAIQLQALALPPEYEAWIISPARGIRQAILDDGPGFVPAPESDTLSILIGSHQALEKSSLFNLSQANLPGFALRTFSKKHGFILQLDLPIQARVKGRLVQLDGRTVAFLKPKWLGAGHHTLVFNENFTGSSGELGRGLYFLWVEHTGKGLPSHSIRRLQILD